MEGAKLLLATILLTAVVGIGTLAAAEDGLKDSHGVWHDSAYWHENHPEWVYRYHPEWAVDHRDWWLADHNRHPEWFGSPYWRRYPVWTYGAYDRGHVWRDAGWWRERDPGWLYAHHPEWAEAHPGWLREDHSRHPEWFHSAYWHDHPRDWNHPDEAYRKELERNVEYQRSHNAEYADHHENFHEGEHAGIGSAEHRNAATAHFHAPAAYHPPAAYHAPTTFHSSASASHSSKH